MTPLWSAISRSCRFSKLLELISRPVFDGQRSRVGSVGS